MVSTVLDVERLKQLIQEKYGSQSAFAEALHVSRQYISQILKGELEPSLERLVQFAELLNVSTDELLGKELALAA
jgi:transcriptional regulator with XRE-family HTH domain